MATELRFTPKALFLTDEDIMLVTANEAAAEIDLSPSTIRSWKRKEWLQVQGWTAAGEPLFSMRDVVEAEYRLRNFGSGRPEGA